MVLFVVVVVLAEVVVVVMIIFVCVVISVAFIVLGKIFVEDNIKILVFHKMENDHPMVPPFDHSKEKQRNNSSLARMINASRQ